MSDDELRDETVAIVSRYIDAINAWDFDTKRTMLHPDMVFEMPFAPPGFDNRIEGAENYLAFAKQAMDIVGDENLHDLRVETFASDPGEALCFYKSDMMIQTTGLPYRNDYIARFTVRDGRITYFAEYYDGVRLLISLGGSVNQATLEGSAAEG
jgi:ketosteroid isomerase-like protein